MSAPVAAEVLRELGARTRTFRSVVSAIVWWYPRWEARRSPKSCSLEVGGTPISREKRDEDAATYALITRCMVEFDPEFDMPEADGKPWPLRAWRIVALGEWFCGIGRTEDGMEGTNRAFFAERFGWSVEVCEHFMGETAGVLSRRMRGRGLIL